MALHVNKFGRPCSILLHSLKNRFVCVDGSPGELSEELVTQEKRKKDWRLNCDVGEATKGLENEL